MSGMSLKEATVLLKDTAKAGEARNLSNRHLSNRHLSNPICLTCRLPETAECVKVPARRRSTIRSRRAPRRWWAINGRRRWMCWRLSVAGADMISI